MSTPTSAPQTPGTSRASADDFQRNRRSPWLQFRRGGWRHIVAWLIIIYALFPILYVVSASLSSDGTLTGSRSALPVHRAGELPEPAHR
ncbi:hypothetical protein QP028_03685 [Corynebacterium suedekumii]|nr:hypothetical protein QP028_03685 [Corynebacterium suedekumii]